MDFCLFNIFSYITNALMLHLTKDLPHVWQFCKLKDYKDFCVAVNISIYIIDLLVFTIWLSSICIIGIQKLSINLQGWFKYFVAFCIMVFSAEIVWPWLLLITHFFTCIYYPWATTAIVLCMGKYIPGLIVSIFNKEQPPFNSDNIAQTPPEVNNANSAQLPAAVQHANIRQSTAIVNDINIAQAPSAFHDANSREPPPTVNKVNISQPISAVVNDANTAQLLPLNRIDTAILSHCSPNEPEASTSRRETVNSIQDPGTSNSFVSAEIVKPGIGRPPMMTSVRKPIQKTTTKETTTVTKAGQKTTTVQTVEMTSQKTIKKTVEKTNSRVGESGGTSNNMSSPSAEPGTTRSGRRYSLNS